MIKEAKAVGEPRSKVGKVCFIVIRYCLELRLQMGRECFVFGFKIGFS